MWADDVGPLELTAIMPVMTHASMELSSSIATRCGRPSRRPSPFASTQSMLECLRMLWPDAPRDVTLRTSRRVDA